ncbi:MAG: RNA methyltransferase, partial [Ferruginibacter sp.]
QAILAEYINWHQDILAIPPNRLNDLAIIQSCLYIKKAGVKIGTIKSGELIPHHELAMSQLLSEFIPFQIVVLATALNYLRRVELGLHIPEKGWKILKYDQLPLGWIKSLGNRINNYYPKEWRILNK